jgi:hypothetical protein
MDRIREKDQYGKEDVIDEANRLGWKVSEEQIKTAADFLLTLLRERKQS